MLTLPLLAALSLAPAQADGLTLTDARITHGILGPTRKEPKFLPGDNLFLTFTISGITADANGKVLYSISTEVSDASGKVLHKQPPQDRDAINALGGGELPAFAQVAVGQQQPPGEYTLKVIVTDLAAKKTQTLTQKFEVLKADFGLVRLMATSDPDAQVPTGLLTAGQSLWISGAVVGFQRGATKQPNVSFELTILDANDKPTLAKPFSGTINKDVPAKDTALPFQFHVALNRAGKYTLEIKATDALANKTVKQSFPFTVHAAK